MTDTERVRDRAVAFTDVPALLGEPLPVLDGDGRLSSWFVPLVDGDRLVGFVELLPDLTHRRTSWFPRRPDSRDGCPPWAWWLDPSSVLEHARAEIRSEETAADPYLSFDGVPDRLAWAVPVQGPHGGRIVFVAGDSAWSGT